jgi:TrmH family RNA methyltransferase
MLVMASEREPHPLLDALEGRRRSRGGEVVETSAEILAKVTGKDNPQAVAGVFREFDTSLAALDRARAPIWLVAQALRDPGNLGTMLRTGDAVGAGGLILLDDSADPFSVEAVRASMGRSSPSRGAGPVGRVPALAALRARPARRASLRDALPYREAPYAAPCFILVGNESRGLPEDYEAACDLRVTMPMKGRADSLNAAVAAAVLAYEVLASLES